MSKVHHQKTEAHITIEKRTLVLLRAHIEEIMQLLWPLPFSTSSDKVESKT